MAVEIPVVVDIEGAFEKAANQVKTASAPLRRAINELNDRLADDMERLNSIDPSSPIFKYLAKDIQDVSQEMEILNDQILRYSTNDGSIKRMNAEMASLARRWEEMGSEQKFTSDGKLTDDAKKLYDDYKKVTEEISRAGRSLAQMEAEEKKILSLRKQGQQSRQYEERVLNSTIKTMRILQEQERMLCRATLSRHTTPHWFGRIRQDPSHPRPLAFLPVPRNTPLLPL